jgi:hypothetical protein
MTRPPVRNGLGFTVAEAERQVRAIESGMSFLPDREAVYREWRRIVVQYGVLGVQVHDARLAAAMRVHRVSHILTLNLADFQPFQRSHRRASRQHPLATPSFTASSFLETTGGLPQLCGRKRLQKCINLGGEDGIAQLFRLVFQG